MSYDCTGVEKHKDNNIDFAAFSGNLDTLDLKLNIDSELNC